VLRRQVSRSRLSWADRVVFAAPAGLFSPACRLYWIVTSAMVLRWPRDLGRYTCTAGHPPGTEILGTHRLARSTVVAICSRVCHHGRRECSEVPLATRSRSETGAVTVSGIYPTCCQLPLTDPSCAGSSLFPQISRCRQSWGSSDRITSSQGVAVSTPGRCDHALVTQSTGTRAAVGHHSSFRGSFRFRLVGDVGCRCW
jgi:hypothetical protein